jgi:tRNA(Ile)-lysidine synthase
MTISSDTVPCRPPVTAFPKGDVAWLDAATVGRDLYVRTRSPGDRFHPLGCPSAKKLKAFLIDAKIARAERVRLPLLVSRAGIAWVAGVRLADWAKVTSATREILRVQLIRHTPEKAMDTTL